jgi:pilus assembly protein CpaE
MQAFLVSDQEPTSARVRAVLSREGYDCPTSALASLDAAVNRLTQERPDLVVVVLSPDPEHGLAVLGELKQKGLLHILSVGPTTDSRLILRALRCGANDFIDELDLESELKTAVMRLRADKTTPAPVETGKTIVVLAPSGGSGSSTLAVNIATALAGSHKTTALLDLKLEAGDTAALLDLKPTYTLADVCQNITRLDPLMFEGSLVRHSSGVHLLAPPRQFTDIQFITPEGVRRALTLARASFPYVVVDLDHTFREEQVQVLHQADLILLLLRMDFTSLRNTRRALEHLDFLGISRDRIRLVVNRYGQPKEVPAATVEEALGLKISHYIPEDAKTVNRANNNGVPVVLDSPSAKVSKSLTKLAASVNGRYMEN